MTQQQLEKKNDDKKAEGGRILRRNNRGCKSKEFYDWPEQALDDMDSPLAVQQYIQQLIRRDPADIDEILKLPENQDLGAWKIEHLRIFCMQLNRLAARLQECCFPDTCNQMTATEQWIFLCAAHKTPNECPAIDYVRHTLDGAASLLNSTKYFPSRVTIKDSSVAKLGSVCRRVYRIFSHAYYHHYQIFDDFERETHLCKRFSQFVTTYELMSKESLIVPADGSKPEQQVSYQTPAGDAPTSTAATATLTTTTESISQGRKSSEEIPVIEKTLSADAEDKDSEKSPYDESNTTVTSWSSTMVKGASSAKTNPDETKTKQSEKIAASTQ